MKIYKTIKKPKLMETKNQKNNSVEEKKQLELSYEKMLAFYESIYEKSLPSVKRDIWKQIISVGKDADLYKRLFSIAIDVLKIPVIIFLFFSVTSCATITQINKPADSCQKIKLEVCGR